MGTLVPLPTSMQAPQTNDMPAAQPRPFWETKTLDQMSDAEWESLCDRCGRCCMIKLEDEDTGNILLTKLSCKLLDVKSCGCSDYENRKSHVPDCVKISSATVPTLRWLPSTCAYRLIAEGQGLSWWHPLVSGSPDTVHEAGISVQGQAISEDRVRPEDIERYIVRDYGRRASRRLPSRRPLKGGAS